MHARGEIIPLPAPVMATGVAVVMGEVIAAAAAVIGWRLGGGGGLIRPRAGQRPRYLLKGRGRGRVVTQRCFGPPRLDTHWWRRPGELAIAHRPTQPRPRLSSTPAVYEAGVLLAPPLSAAAHKGAMRARCGTDGRACCMPQAPLLGLEGAPLLARGRLRANQSEIDSDPRSRQVYQIQVPEVARPAC